VSKSTSRNWIFGYHAPNPQIHLELWCLRDTCGSVAVKMGHCSRRAKWLMNHPNMGDSWITQIWHPGEKLGVWNGRKTSKKVWSYHHSIIDDVALFLSSIVLLHNFEVLNGDFFVFLLFQSDLETLCFGLDCRPPLLLRHPQNIHLFYLFLHTIFVMVVLLGLIFKNTIHWWLFKRWAPTNTFSKILSALLSAFGAILAWLPRLVAAVRSGRVAIPTLWATH